MRLKSIGKKVLGRILELLIDFKSSFLFKARRIVDIGFKKKAKEVRGEGVQISD